MEATKKAGGKKSGPMRSFIKLSENDETGARTPIDLGEITAKKKILLNLFCLLTMHRERRRSDVRRGPPCRRPRSFYGFSKYILIDLQ